MSKLIEDNVYMLVKKNKIDQYPLSGKVRNFALKNDVTYILVNSRGKMVAYYVFKLEKRVFKLVHSNIDEKYEKYMDEFDMKVASDMKWKILTGFANRVAYRHTLIYARPTPIPYISLITLVLVCTLVFMVLTQQVGLGFLLGASIAYLFGVKQEKI